MASALNKRQQARNERTLQELIKTVPGNGTCADCSARNPGWASWSLGIFLCMRCAAIHRKLGTHISKVKSLSMDKWDNAQVDHMKRMGNVESNKTYNPRNTRPQIPIDIDEVDGAMERFIRQKYEQRAFIQDSQPGTRQNTGSTSSVEDKPPPLPPKPSRRFGFGLQKSSSFPRGGTPPVSPSIGGFIPGNSPPRVNKPSRVFGSNVNTSGDGLDSKLATLRDMGFADERRNSTVLKGLNGNLDKTVEALIRLGEQNPIKSRGNTPTPPEKPPAGLNGLSFDTARTAPAAKSMNPFDALDMAPPQPQLQQQPQVTSVQTQQLPYSGSSTQPTSPANPYNPFLSHAQQGSFQQQGYPQQQPQQQQQQQFLSQQQNPFGQQQETLDQSFQGLQLSNQQPQQALFPNRTGGYGPPQIPQTNPFHQSFTPPPMPQMPPQYGSFFPQQSQQPYYQALASPTSPGNPFLKPAKSQMFTTANSMNSNPFGQQQQTQQQQAQYQMQPQQQQFQQPQFQQTQAQAPQQQPQYQQQNQPQYQQQVSNPYTMQQQNSAQSPNPWQGQPQGFQQPTSFDKHSILALYNHPQLAPQRSEITQPSPIPASTATSAAPVSGNMNPFALSQAQNPQVQQQPAGLSVGLDARAAPGIRHVSNESVDFAGLMGGRHSPDAFSGLSSSFRR